MDDDDNATTNNNTFIIRPQIWIHRKCFSFLFEYQQQHQQHKYMNDQVKLIVS